MMRMMIAERLKPFTHSPGVFMYLPGSVLGLQIFPAQISIYDISCTLPKLLEEVSLSMKGPVKDFTIVQDLEKCSIHVFGHAVSGYFCYTLSARFENKIGVNIEKGKISFSSRHLVLSKENDFCLHVKLERLSLGSHKAQDWEMIVRRKDLKEIFPLWHRLGQMVIDIVSTEEGTASLLKDCNKQKPESVVACFQKLFEAGFQGMFFPRINDESHLGLDLERVEKLVEGSPLVLLKEGARLIRSLFLRQTGEKIFILPMLPPQFHCGRFLHLDCPPYGVIDMEWSKKEIRRMVFHAYSEASLEFKFPSNIKEYRLRCGKKSQLMAADAMVRVESDHTYFFDNFRR